MAAGSTALLTVQILVDAAKAKQGIKDVKEETGGFGDTMGKLAKPAAVAFGLVAAGAIGAAKAAADDAASQAVLAQTMKNSAGASKAAIAANEDFIASLAQATGVADDQLRPALGSLVRATGDVAKSQDALKTALDVSTATGKPLQAVSEAISKGYGGNTAALGKLVPGLDKATVKSGDMNKIMAELARTTGGSAAAAADTAAGKMARAANAMDEAKESAGTALLPVLDKLAEVMATVGIWAQNNSTTFLILAGAIGAIAGAVLLVNAAMKVYQATLIVVKAVQNATFLTNPVFLVIVAIVALIAIIVLLVKNWDKVKAVAAAAWNGIKAGAAAVWNWISSHWPLLVVILFGPIGAAVVLIIKNFDRIKAAAAAVWGAIKSGASAVASFLAGVWSRISGAASTAWGALRRAGTAALDALLAPARALRAAFDAVVSAIRSVIDWISRIKVPKIPGLSSILKVVPGSAAVRVGSSLGAARAAASPGLLGVVGAPAPMVAGAGGVTINVYGILDGVDGARKLRAVLRDDDRRRSGVRVKGRSR